jgi:iron complex transport system substrate-binding protein
MQRSSKILIGLLLGGGLLAAGWWALPTLSCGPMPAAPLRKAGIVSLSPGVTETLFALGLGKRIVGVTKFCQYPPEAQQLPRIGGFFDPNVEAIVSLTPEMAILLPEQQSIGQRLERFGISTLVVDDADLQAVCDTIRTLGKELGASAQAAQLLARIEHDLAEITERIKERPRPSTLLCIGRRYGEGTPVDVTGVGSGGLHDEMLKLAGGTNACVSDSVPYPTLSREAIMRMNPEVIIDLTANAASAQIGADVLRADWNALPHVDAVKQNRVYVLSDDAFMIPGPRFVQSVRRFAELIHPDADWDQP